MQSAVIICCCCSCSRQREAVKKKKNEVERKPENNKGELKKKMATHYSGAVMESVLFSDSNPIVGELLFRHTINSEEAEVKSQQE